MVAKKLIHGLQDRSDETAKKETIKLARTYGNIEPKTNLCIDHLLIPLSPIGLASSFTSFVAVDPMKPDTTLVNLKNVNHLSYIDFLI